MLSHELVLYEIQMIILAKSHLTYHQLDESARLHDTPQEIAIVRGDLHSRREIKSARAEEKEEKNGNSTCVVTRALEVTRTMSAYTCVHSRGKRERRKKNGRKKKREKERRRKRWYRAARPFSVRAPRCITPTPSGPRSMCDISAHKNPRE